MDTEAKNENRQRISPRGTDTHMTGWWAGTKELLKEKQNEKKTN